MVFVEISNRDRFTRSIFGISLIFAFFFNWGIYISVILGILLVLSATTGLCITCWVYEKIFGVECETCKIDYPNIKEN